MKFDLKFKLKDRANFVYEYLFIWFYSVVPFVLISWKFLYQPNIEG